MGEDKTQVKEKEKKRENEHEMNEEKRNHFSFLLLDSCEISNSFNLFIVVFISKMSCCCGDMAPDNQPEVRLCVCVCVPRKEKGL